MQIKLSKERNGGAWILLLIFAAGVLALGGCVAGAVLKRTQEIEKKREQALTNAVDELVLQYRPHPEHEFAAPPQDETKVEPGLDYTKDPKHDPWYDESGF